MPKRNASAPNPNDALKANADTYLRTVAEIKAGMVAEGENTPRDIAESEIRQWMGKQSFNQPRIDELEAFIAKSSTEELVHFTVDNFSDVDILTMVYVRLFADETSKRELFDYLINAWLQLEENPGHDTANFMATYLPDLLTRRGVKVDKERELSRKKGELEKGLHNTTQQFIRQVLDFAASDDVQLRLGATRNLQLLCASSLIYYIADPKVKSAVRAALTKAKTDVNSSVRRAAKDGLNMLKENSR